ncbi:nucleotidyl transferase [archaeon]|nr:nucleotidyl transferase [archaeon]|tara:strand:- start:385 stop:1176 length:792 start_codon:yes stop_codon:yes gene_type:complete
MKAIILAAGMGTRLGHYTENLPKCMLPFNGRPLIEQQVENLRKAGITDITIVKGYMPEKINVPGTKTYISHNYATTNMVETLFCAEAEMDGGDDVLVCYADILYEPQILRKIIRSKVDVGVTVDEDYWDYWCARDANPESDMESLVVDHEGEILSLGDTKCSRNEAKLRYVGLIKFSKAGLASLQKVYHENREKYFDVEGPWLRSKSFKKAYMTCMIQAIINSGQKVKPIIVHRGWLEFDTVADLENYTRWQQEGTLHNFIDV